jgi:hypothetical protein
MRLIRQTKLRSAVVALAVLFGSATGAHADPWTGGPADQQARAQSQLHEGQRPGAPNGAGLAAPGGGTGAPASGGVPVADGAVGAGGGDPSPTSVGSGPGDQAGTFAPAPTTPSGQPTTPTGQPTTPTGQPTTPTDQPTTPNPGPTTPTGQPTTPSPPPTTPGDQPGASGPSDQASGSAGGWANSPQSQSPPPTGPTSAATGSTQTAPPAAPVESAAVQAGTTQAANEFRASSSPADQGSGSAASTHTGQTIVQLQISGCTAHCQGTSQTQMAQQANTTVQVLGGDTQAVAATGPGSGSGDGSQITSSVTQIQLGCLAHCFGITTTSAAVSGGIEQTIEQLLSILASNSSSHAALAASQQSVVDQTSYQWQGGPTSQTQVAVQTNTTIQVVDLASKIAAALAPSDPNAAAATNQTEQGIWQLQAGCLVFCSQTGQSQQAQQSNTIVQVLSPSAGQPTGTAGAVTNVGRQVIYQLQIGCLFWCYDATEQQAASQTTTTQQVLISSPPPGSGPPPTAGAQTAPTSAPQTTPASAPQTTPASAPQTPPSDGPQPALPAPRASAAPVGGASGLTSSGVSVPAAGGFLRPAPGLGSAHPTPRVHAGPRPLPKPGEPRPSAQFEAVSDTASSASALATSVIVATPPARLTTGQRVMTATTTALAEEPRRFEGRRARPVRLAGLPWRPVPGPSVVSAHDPSGGFGVDAGVAGAVACVTFLALLLAMRRLARSRD